MSHYVAGAFPLADAPSSSFSCWRLAGRNVPRCRARYRWRYRNYLAQARPLAAMTPIISHAHELYSGALSVEIFPRLMLPDEFLRRHRLMAATILALRRLVIFARAGAAYAAILKWPTT